MERNLINIWDRNMSWHTHTHTCGDGEYKVDDVLDPGKSSLKSHSSTENMVLTRTYGSILFSPSVTFSKKVFPIPCLSSLLWGRVGRCWVVCLDKKYQTVGSLYRWNGPIWNVPWNVDVENFPFFKMTPAERWDYKSWEAWNMLTKKTIAAYFVNIIWHNYHLFRM